MESLDPLVSLAKRRGFIYQGSEIYGGLAGTWDYGPLGVALKKNIENLWWKRFVSEREDMYGVDAAILMHPKVWESSEHVSGFSDPLVDCKKCGTRYRADHLVTDAAAYAAVQKEIRNLFNDAKTDFDKKNLQIGELLKLSRDFNQKVEDKNIPLEARTYLLDAWEKVLDKADAEGEASAAQLKEMKEKLELLQDSKKYLGAVTQIYLERYERCAKCGSSKWGTPRQFNMMFKTSVGAMEDSTSTIYLRPETAGGMFVNFKNIIDSFHPKLPFGMAQIGKAFRNEITPRDFIFRVRELEQMEIEYFVRPDAWEETFKALLDEQQAFLKELGLSEEKLHRIEVPAEDRAHYSKHSVDTEYDFPFGQKELLGIAYRTDFDLSAHAKGSGQDLSYFDEETKERFVPHVIEPTFGLGRLLLAVLCDAYREDELGGEKRVYLALKPNVAPVKVAVFPLLKNKPELVAKAREVYAALKKEFGAVVFDDNGNIGKRYRRQDEIGTPWCVTIDFDTLGEGGEEVKDTVTVRDRDSGEQKRIAVGELSSMVKAGLLA